MMEIRRATRSVRNPSQHGLADPSNHSCKTRTRILRTKNNHPPPGNEDNEGRDDDHEDNKLYNLEETVLYDAKENKERLSLVHKGKSSSSEFSESSKNVAE